MQGREIGRITEYGWQLVARENDDGSEVFFLNKRDRLGRMAGSIIMDKDQLRKLKHFMEDRKIE